MHEMSNSHVAHVDVGFYQARIADLEVELVRAQKIIESQRRAVDMLVERLAELEKAAFPDRAPKIHKHERAR